MYARVFPIDDTTLDQARHYASKTLVDPGVSPESREQYRQLAAALHHAQTARGVKAVIIASAVAGEGKTLTAANLALTFSDAYHRRVLLVDADLRRPSIHRLFPAHSADATQSTPHTRSITPRLSILTRSQPSASPMAELTSTVMRQRIEEARRAFDWIIIDTPPIGLLPDAGLLASVVDGAVFVVRAGSTPLDLVKRAVNTLDPQKVLGVVLNAASRPARQAAYGYGDYHSELAAG